MLRSGFLPIILLFAGGFGTTAAFADGEDGRADDDRIARLTKAQEQMRRMLQKGEKLEAAGKLEGALECYEQALTAYDAVMRDLGRDPKSMRSVFARRRGASAETDKAVSLALAWLARHQDENGCWDAKGFAKHDPRHDRCDGPGKELYSVGVTGLALLAYLDAGHTDRGSKRDNRYSGTVRQGLRYLMTVQDDEGCIGPRTTMHFIYNHAIATAALSEAYALTKNPRYKAPAARAVRFLFKARNPYLGWRYGVRGGENDTSVTGWCVHALARARAARVPMDGREWEAAMDGAMTWLEKATNPESGRTGYNRRGGAVARPEGMQDKFPPEKSEAMTASALAMRTDAGQTLKGEGVRKALELLAARPPAWKPDSGSIDLYYWFWGTRACGAVGGPTWKAWNTALKKAVITNQHREGSGSRMGSWDPIGPWGPDGGRVYSTALLALTLQSYYRPAR